MLTCSGHHYNCGNFLTIHICRQSDTFLHDITEGARIQQSSV